ncbi:hypothetical protein ABGT22_19305 [Peribacillus frigoritolerans]|uniref:hypothetical protein n=1 Tax=Peribacillus frigoritolerans TaxID=450367 RepID=UPI00345D45CA
MNYTFYAFTHFFILHLIISTFTPFIPDFIHLFILGSIPQQPELHSVTGLKSVKAE